MKKRAWVFPVIFGWVFLMFNIAFPNGAQTTSVLTGWVTVILAIAGGYLGAWYFASGNR